MAHLEFNDTECSHVFDYQYSLGGTFNILTMTRQRQAYKLQLSVRA